MRYHSTSDPSRRASLEEVLLRSIDANDGLYMPETIPVLNENLIREMEHLTPAEIAYRIAKPVFENDIPDSVLKKIAYEALNFEIPVVEISNGLYVLELFHGPTFAFKDVGARFLAGLLSWFAGKMNKEITVLVATSGDTGGAVASAFSEKEGIRVVVLYPAGRISSVQERQITQAGRNITAVKLQGDFDDCQRLVKMAFSDTELTRKTVLTSANSINFGRLFPQAVYYFHAVSKIRKDTNRIAVSVPSGNFGNLTSGIIAARMGLDISRFIASTNINNSVPLYLKTGIFTPHPSFKTISSAMDVGSPGNFKRILHLFGNNHNAIKNNISGYWFSDDDTRAGIRELYETYNYLADPHTAVAYLGLKKYRDSNMCTGVFLATAHPGKFADETFTTTGIVPEVPPFKPARDSVRLISPNDYSFIRKILDKSF